MRESERPVLKRGLHGVYHHASDKHLAPNLESAEEHAQGQFPTMHVVDSWIGTIRIFPHG